MSRRHHDAWRVARGVIDGAALAAGPITDRPISTESLADPSCYSGDAAVETSRTRERFPAVTRRVHPVRTPHQPRTDRKPLYKPLTIPKTQNGCIH